MEADNLNKGSTQNRRSSILKIPRNERIEEMDLDENVMDVTTCKSIKRVSFASSNFVKPFANDPDKNTIWDTTYEEHVLHSDSSASSHEQTSGCSRFNATTSSKNNATNVSVQDMDLTNKDRSQFASRFSIVDYSKKLSSGLTVPVYTLPSSTHEKHFPDCDDSNVMEFTCQSSLTVDICNPHTMHGPIKKTICGATYEEPVAQADLSASSREQTSSCSRFNATTSSKNNATNLAVQDMDLTNKDLSSQFGSTFSIVDYAKKLSSGLVTPLYTMPPSIHEKRPLDCDGSNVMEFTCQTSLIENTYKPKTTHKTKTESATTTGTFLNTVDMSISRQTSEIIDKQIDYDMELTCKMPVMPAMDVDASIGEISYARKECSVTSHHNRTEMGECDEVIDKANRPAETKAKLPSCTFTELDRMCKSSACQMAKKSDELDTPPVTPNVFLKATTFPVVDDRSPSRFYVDREVCHYQRTPQRINNILYTQRLPKELKRTFTISKTPDPSFNVNWTNVSSGVDDTQQLIHCTYVKSNQEHETKDDSLMLQVEDEVSKPNLTDIILGISDQPNDVSNMSENSSDVSVDMKNRLFAVNDTYVLRGKKNSSKDAEKENVEIEGSVDSANDSSLGIISNLDVDELPEENLKCLKQSPVLDENVPVSAKTKPIDLFEMKPFHLDIKRMADVEPLLQDVKKQREEIIAYLKNFKVKPMNVVAQFLKNAETSGSGCSDIPNESITKICNNSSDLSLEEQIRERHKSVRYWWHLKNVEHDIYEFCTLQGKLIFVVQLNLDNGAVIDLETRSLLTEQSHPVGKYMMKLYMIKLEVDRIRSTIGETFDIFSLLDYVHMTSLKFHEFQKVFVFAPFMSIMSVDDGFIGKWLVMSPHLSLDSEISLNVVPIENLNFEDLKIVNKVGVLNESDIKNLAANCPKGLDFFKTFRRAIDDYIKAKVARRRL